LLVRHFFELVVLLNSSLNHAQDLSRVRVISLC